MPRASRRLAWIAAVCALAVLVGCGGTHARFEHHLHRGEQFLAAGALDKASVEFRNALQLEPRNAHALYFNGVVAERRGEPRDAAGYYRAVLDVDPEDAGARAALARLLVLAGAAQQALPVIEAGLGRHPDDARLLTARAAARLQLEDARGALADAERAVQLAPDDEDAVGALAGIYQRQGETSQAVELVNAAVVRKPASLGLRQVLAGLYLAAHDEVHAEEQLNRIIALAPRDLGLRYGLAGFYQHAGRIDTAQQVLERAVRDFSGSNQPKLVLADFVFEQRSHEQGEQVLRGYLARDAGNQELRLELARLLARAGAAAQAAGSLQELIAADPRGAYALAARDRLAALEVSQGRSEEARRQVAAVLEQNPRDAEALLLRSGLAADAHNPQAAIADLRAVLRDQPNSIGVQRLLARAYLADHEPALAEATLRAALESVGAGAGSAESGTLRLDLAQQLLQRGRADQSVTVLEEGVRAAPRDVRLREALVRAYVAKHDLVAARIAAEDLKTLEPTAAVAPYLAGLVAGQQGRLDDARREFERALELEPRAIEALAALARMQLAHGQSAAALARVRAAATADANDPATLNLLGEVLIATRAYAQAVPPLTEATRLAPRWPLPYRTLASAQLGSGDGAGAVAAYRNGLQQAPFDPGLTSDLAALYEQQGDVDRAIALYEALHAHDPRLEMASNNLAMLLVTYRRDHSSLERARELTEEFARSESGALLDTHGWVRFKLGDVDDALPLLERAASRAPDSRVIRCHLGIAELKAGERDKARRDLEAALTGAGSFPGSDEARAALNSLNAAGRS